MQINVTLEVVFLDQFIIFRKTISFNLLTYKNNKFIGLFSSVLSYSWPLLFFGLTASILSWTDSFILGYFIGVEEVGFYNAAIPIALFLMIFTQIFMQLFFPLITKEYAKGNKEIVKKLSEQTGKWIFMLNMPLFVLMIFFPGVFINFLFGPEYLVATNPLRFLAIGFLFNSLFRISNQLIVVEGRSKILLIDSLLVSILNLGLNMLLIPKYARNGAGFATMLSLITLNFIFLFQSKRYTGVIPLKKEMIKIFFISFLSGILILFLSEFFEINILSLLLLGIFFILIYLLLLFQSKSLDENDLMILKAFKNKLQINNI